MKLTTSGALTTEHENPESLIVRAETRYFERALMFCHIGPKAMVLKQMIV
jgi:hypothetical protein